MTPRIHRTHTSFPLLIICLLLVLASAGCRAGIPSSPSPSSPPQQVMAPTESQPLSTLSVPSVAPTQGRQGFSQSEMEEARKAFPPEICLSVLTGAIQVPEEINQCLRENLGEGRLKELCSGAQPTGQEKDTCAICLWASKISPESLLYSVTRVDSSYRVAPGNLSGWFTSGQEADIMLSGIDFNNAGGPLLFNHPKGIATDGVHLLLADGNNNRVLIWNSLPSGNTPPDLVLGQPDFITNYPGTGRSQMNWPVGVATDGKRVVVADTYNDRILIWNQFPTQNAAPADIVLDGKAGFEFGKPAKNGFSWPWGVWTDGQKLVVSSTQGGYVLIWNRFPTRDNQPADIYLTAAGNMGTPRTITSDGKSLIIGDHNAKNTESPIGNFFWKSFPTTDDAPYDFFRPDPIDSYGAWMTGDFTPDGKLLMLGATLHIWNRFPSTADEPPALSISGFRFTGGDGASLAIAGQRVYVSLYNGNRIVVYNNLPADPQQEPDFAIGSPDIHTNTLDTHYFVTNGVPATNGKSLFVSSDFDRRLYVWKQIPDQSGAYPDLVYSLREAPWDNALWNNTLVLAGKDAVTVWKTLPVEGQPPDISFKGHIGGVTFRDLRGVALDDKYLYLSDFEGNKIYVWEGIPEADAPPLLSMNVDGPWRLSSDGEYLVVTSIYNHSISVYRISGLSEDARPVATIGGPRHLNLPISLNLPQNAIVSHGSLFIADSGFNRVYIWKNIADALNGEPPDTELGKGGFDVPPLPVKDGFFTPAGLAFDGHYLWVGEFKFSFRLLRFAVR